MILSSSKSSRLAFRLLKRVKSARASQVLRKSTNLITNQQLGFEHSSIVYSHEYSQDVPVDTDPEEYNSELRSEYDTGMKNISS